MFIIQYQIEGTLKTFPGETVEILAKVSVRPQRGDKVLAAEFYAELDGAQDEASFELSRHIWEVAEIIVGPPVVGKDQKPEIIAIIEPLSEKEKRKRKRRKKKRDRDRDDD